MSPIRIACKLIRGRIEAKECSLGASAPGISSHNSCALEGHGPCSSFLRPSWLGFHPSTLNPRRCRGLSYFAPTGLQADIVWHVQAKLGRVKEQEKDHGQPRTVDRATPSIKHILSLAAHKIPHDLGSYPR